MDNATDWFPQALGVLGGILAQTGSVILTLLPGALVVAVLTYLVAIRQLKLKRYMDATNSFIDVTGHAHGYPRGDRSASVGIAEQVAAIWLIVELANEFPFLRRPGREALNRLQQNFSNIENEAHTPSWSIIADCAQEALNAVTPQKR